MPHMSLRKYLPTGSAMIGCVIFLSFLGVGIYQQINTTLQVRLLVNDTRDILGDASELNILIRDAERGQRGYLLTGRPAYLEPYDAALKRLPVVYERFRQRSAGNPGRRQEYDALWSLIQQRLVVLAQGVQLRTDSGEAEARQILLYGSGKGLMGRITMMLDTITGEENQQLAERKVEWERDDVETRMLIAVGSGVTMLLLALAALMLRRNAEQRREVERDREQQQRRELERSQADLREMTLRNTASQYARSLLEASLDPLITISTEGKITDLNQATVKVTGKPRELLIGTDFSDYFTEPEKAREGYQRVFAEGSVTDYPLTIRHRDQNLTDVLYNASVYRDAAGNVLGVFAAARDITKQKQAEAAITRQRTEELERLTELERFKTLTVGRELKMIELKKEITELKKIGASVGVA